MLGLPPIVVSALTGFVSGFVISIPVGPVNLGIANEGAQRGFRHAFLIGAGASIMEMIYCAVAFTGFASFFQSGYVKAVMELVSFAFMVTLGLRFLMASSVPDPSRLEKNISGRFHPRSPFMSGVVMVMANPGVLLSWIIFSASFISRGLVESTMTSKCVCVLGVTLGTNAWFSGLAYAVSLGHKKFSEKTLLRMERGSGISLLVVGAAYGAHIAWQMAKHKL